jgi:hypothetical protein
MHINLVVDPLMNAQPAVASRSAENMGDPVELGEEPPSEGVCSDRPVDVADEQPESPHKWLSYALPISIALVAIVGSIVGYRVERSAGKAAELDQSAISASIESQRVYSDALVQAGEARGDYESWLQLTRQVSPQLLSRWCQVSPTSINSLVAANQVVDCQLQEVFLDPEASSYHSPGTPPTSFDSKKYANDMAASARFFLTTDTTTWEQDATTARGLEKKFLGLGVILALALILCTAAQQTHHRKWLSRYPLAAPLALAIPGWALLFGSATLLLIWGYGSAGGY